MTSISIIPLVEIVVMIVALPSTISPVPTTVSFTIIDTGPLGTGRPVSASVTVTSMVTFPTTLLVTSASVMLSRGPTVIATVVLVPLYVSSPG